MGHSNSNRLFTFCTVCMCELVKKVHVFQSVCIFCSLRWMHAYYIQPNAPYEQHIFILSQYRLDCIRHISKFFVFTFHSIQQFKSMIYGQHFRHTKAICSDSVKFRMNSNKFNFNVNVLTNILKICIHFSIQKQRYVTRDSS